MTNIMSDSDKSNFGRLHYVRRRTRRIEYYITETRRSNSGAKSDETQSPEKTPEKHEEKKPITPKPKHQNIESAKKALSRYQSKVANAQNALDQWSSDLPSIEQPYDPGVQKSSSYKEYKIVNARRKKFSTRLNPDKPPFRDPAPSEEAGDIPKPTILDDRKSRDSYGKSSPHQRSKDNNTPKPPISENKKIYEGYVKSGPDQRPREKTTPKPANTDTRKSHETTPKPANIDTRKSHETTPKPANIDTRKSHETGCKSVPPQKPKDKEKHFRFRSKDTSVPTDKKENTTQHDDFQKANNVKKELSFASLSALQSKVLKLMREVSMSEVSQSIGKSPATEAVIKISSIRPWFKDTFRSPKYNFNVESPKLVNIPGIMSMPTYGYTFDSTRAADAESQADTCASLSTSCSTSVLNTASLRGCYSLTPKDDRRKCASSDSYQNLLNNVSQKSRTTLRVPQMKSYVSRTTSYEQCSKEPEPLSLTREPWTSSSEQKTAFSSEQKTPVSSEPRTTVPSRLKKGPRESTDSDFYSQPSDVRPNSRANKRIQTVKVKIRKGSDNSSKKQLKSSKDSTQNKHSMLPRRSPFPKGKPLQQPQAQKYHASTEGSKVQRYVTMSETKRQKDDVRTFLAERKFPGQIEGKAVLQITSVHEHHDKVLSPSDSPTVVCPNCGASGKFCQQCLHCVASTNNKDSHNSSPKVAQLQNQEILTEKNPQKVMAPPYNTESSQTCPEQKAKDHSPKAEHNAQAEISLGNPDSPLQVGLWAIPTSPQVDLPKGAVNLLQLEGQHPFADREEQNCTKNILSPLHSVVPYRQSPSPYLASCAHIPVPSVCQGDLSKRGCSCKSMLHHWLQLQQQLLLSNMTVHQPSVVVGRKISSSDNSSISSDKVKGQAQARATQTKSPSPPVKEKTRAIAKTAQKHRHNKHAVSKFSIWKYFGLFLIYFLKGVLSISTFGLYQIPRKRLRHRKSHRRHREESLISSQSSSVDPILRGKEEHRDGRHQKLQRNFGLNNHPERKSELSSSDAAVYRTDLAKGCLKNTYNDITFENKSTWPKLPRIANKEMRHDSFTQTFTPWEPLPDAVTQTSPQSINRQNAGSPNIKTTSVQVPMRSTMQLQTIPEYFSMTSPQTTQTVGVTESEKPDTPADSSEDHSLAQQYDPYSTDFSDLLYSVQNNVKKSTWPTALTFENANGDGFIQNINVQKQGTTRFRPPLRRRQLSKIVDNVATKDRPSKLPLQEKLSRLNTSSPPRSTRQLNRTYQVNAEHTEQTRPKLAVFNPNTFAGYAKGDGGYKQKKIIYLGNPNKNKSTVGANVKRQSRTTGRYAWR